MPTLKNDRASGRLSCAAACLLLIACAALVPRILRAQDSPEPYFDGRKAVHVYPGPGRDDPAPADLREIRIGYFGPRDPNDPAYGDLWLAAGMAVDEINTAGGYQGLPFRLLSAWSKNPWGSGVSQVTRMVFADEILALIAGADGATAHLAEQIVAKALLPLVNPDTADRTVNLAHVPWVFSCLPGGQMEAAAITNSLLDEIGRKPFLLISATDHDARVLTAELRDDLGRRGVAPARHLEVTSAEGRDLDIISSRLLSESQAAAVVLIADPTVTARLLKRIRLFFDGPVFGSSSMARSVFLRLTGNDTGPLRFPFPADFAGVEEFSRRFRAVWGHDADFAAAQTYDALHLIAAALDLAGPNRARLGDALRSLSPWRGVAGTLAWDRTGQNTRPVTMATLENGRIRPLKLSSEN
jgi:branched-chain amino acid transport system substrate-binding protein